MADTQSFSPAGRVRALAYNLLFRGADALHRAAAPSLHTTANAPLYIAAGLLREDDLRTASLVRWSRFGTAVEHADVGLLEWERRLYDDVLRLSDRVLVVGCGTGRDLLALIGLGYTVAGFDQADEVVDLARRNLARRGLHARVWTAAVETVDLDEAYNVVIFSDGCYSSVRHSATRVATLRRMRERLLPNGRVIIAYTTLVKQSRLSLWLTRISAALARANWRPERGDSFSRDSHTARLLRFEHRFRSGDVASECAAAGLRLVRDESVNELFRAAVAVPAE